MSGEVLELEGTCTTANRGVYTVLVTIGGTARSVTAKLNGRLATHRIRVMPGDSVRLEVSPYDLNRGRITYRNDTRRNPAPGDPTHAQR